MGKKKKVRVEFRKNRAKPPRANDLTGDFAADDGSADDAVSGERVRARGDLSRARTITLDAAGGHAASAAGTAPGRVLRMQGLHTVVELDDGRLARCGVRRLLKTMATDERGAVVVGDRVWVRLAGQASRPREGTEVPPGPGRPLTGTARPGCWKA